MKNHSVELIPGFLFWTINWFPEIWIGNEKMESFWSFKKKLFSLRSLNFPPLSTFSPSYAVLFRLKPLLEGKFYLWPIVTHPVRKQFSIFIKTTTCNCVRHSVRCFQFRSSVFVPERVTAIRPSCGKCIMHRMECNIIHLKFKFTSMQIWIKMSVVRGLKGEKIRQYF